MDWWTCNRKYDCIHSVALSKPKVSSGGISKIIYLLHSDSYCSVTSMWGWTLFMCACDLKNVISTPPPSIHTHMRIFSSSDDLIISPFKISNFNVCLSDWSNKFSWKSGRSAPSPWKKSTPHEGKPYWKIINRIKWLYQVQKWILLLG